MKIVMHGRIPSKKNSKIISMRGKRPVLLSSKKYSEWEEKAIYEMAIGGVVRSYLSAVEITIKVYFPDRRVADLTNKAESIMDALVKYGVIEDDSWKICRKLTLEGFYDKEDPRAEIEIKVL